MPFGPNHRSDMYPIYEIDEVQVTKIMATQENYLNDIKAREIKPAKLSETISAFSNATAMSTLELAKTRKRM